MIATTRDTVYQGRVQLVQPEKGFRAGTDSLLLAAALPNIETGTALEIGTGCGGALLPAAYRLPRTLFDGVELDADMVRLANKGAELNGWAERVSVEHEEASDWVRAHENRYDLVFSNPPYFEPGKISEPGEGKQRAYLETLDLEGWLKAMLFTAKPRAPVILIHRAAELPRILSRMDKQTGELTVLPIASKAGEPARRVLVRGRKGLKRGPLTLLAPFITHEADGTASAALEAVREAKGIEW